MAKKTKENQQNCGCQEEASHCQPNCDCGDTSCEPACECGCQDSSCDCDQDCECQSRDDQTAVYIEAAKRIKADFENYKRRNENMRAEALIEGAGRALLPLLEVLDNLQRAMEQKGTDGFSKGIEQIVKQFEDALTAQDIKPIEGVGELLDPAIQMAVGQEMRPGVEAGCVTQVLKKGYFQGEKLLRPAMVLVQAEA